MVHAKRKVKEERSRKKGKGRKVRKKCSGKIGQG